ncbi:hypothetical protein JD969_06560 [Planctomycetota bacterium]|nr:hypothetical protein JD969_06560 [Planctomycetota bacterium]
MSFRNKADNVDRQTLRRKPVPLRTGTFGMQLFLFSIGILFLASMIGFLIIDFQIRQPYDVIAYTDGSPENRTITPDIPNVHMPYLLYLSSILIIASSFTMSSALKHVQYQRIPQFTRMIKITLFLAIAFILVQAPAAVELLEQHRAMLANSPANDEFMNTRQLALFGFIVFLIALHAAHVIGGIIPLGLITRNAVFGRYDHECYGPVKYITMYWHFLDAVWLVMFVVLLVAV